MTSATEVLRRMLDENDEYYKTSGNKTWWGRPIDRQTGKPINVFHCQAQPMGEDRLLVELQLATPEQAIAATLGATDARPTQVESSGTCTVEGFDDGIDEALDGSPIYTTPTWYLSCGHTCEGAERPSFCKNCGRKVVSE